MITTPKAIATRNAGNTPIDKLARKISAEAETVAPRHSDMMLPVSVMKVMPTATQPMNEMALSSALMLSGEVNPGVERAKMAIAPPATMRIASTICRAHTRPNPSLDRRETSLMRRRPDG